MTTGLVIGKFMPPHNGHLELIKYGIRNSDSLIVGVCSVPSEPIPGKIRYDWMREILKEYANVKVEHITDDLPQDSKPSRTASKIWAEYLINRFGTIDKIFSSEKYGDYLAEYMGAKHECYDSAREKIPVSGTCIRDNPFNNWEYIPETVKPYFALKICIYGTESTGKSTLTRQLAEYYNTNFVQEMAREYIEAKGNSFVYEDLAEICRVHRNAEDAALKKSNRMLFCDTDAITTKIYSKHYFGKVDPFVESAADEDRYALYLFTDTDLPWVADPQRDLADRREEFKEIFRKELESRNRKYVMISGKGEERLMNAVHAVDSFLKEKNLQYYMNQGRDTGLIGA